ncbi:hypothetical protein GCM10017566_32560 [Amycolatopsis bartoniae]|uniref:Uncharacterized protein n=1 Tax=Amycolatopsis bartoniae TaxID=941986 RepID=A0A8H9IV95_9PSEU|nr:hypothetical protein GCM10017566_32560 [Amycolatopsis bartoniae]
MREIFDSEARISHAACARVTPAASRNRRSWVPRIIRRAVGPVPGSTPEVSTGAIGPSWIREGGGEKTPSIRKYTAVGRGQVHLCIYPSDPADYPSCNVSFTTPTR